MNTYVDRVAEERDDLLDEAIRDTERLRVEKEISTKLIEIEKRKAEIRLLKKKQMVSAKHVEESNSQKLHAESAVQRAMDSGAATDKINEVMNASMRKLEQEKLRWKETTKPEVDDE